MATYLESEFNELNALYTEYINGEYHDETARAEFLNNAFNKLNLMNKLIALAANGVKVEEQIEIKNNESTKAASENAAAMMGGFIEESSIESNTTENNITEDNKEDVENGLTVEFSANTIQSPKIDAVAHDTLTNLDVTSEDTKEEIERELTETEKLVNNLTERICKLSDEDNENKSEDEIAAEKAAKEERAKEAEDFIDSYGDYTLEQLFTEEFESWGIKPTYAGCKNIINLEKACELSNNTLKLSSSLEYIENYLAQANNISEQQLKRNINNIISKADFSKSKFLPVLSKLDKSVISEEIILKEFLEFCVEA
jgi:hypothetical protein